MTQDSARSNAPGLADSEDLFDFDDLSVAAEAQAGPDDPDIAALIRALEETPDPGEPGESPGASAGPRPRSGRAQGSAPARHSVLLLAGLGLVILLNVSAVLYFLRSSTSMQESLAKMGTRITEVTSDLRDETRRQGETLQRVASPIVPPEPGYAEFFDEVDLDLAAGRPAAAQQRLYALLCVTDRIAPDERREVEARCQFLLAQALELEAGSAEEPR